METNNTENGLLEKAKSDLMADMESRGIGAIIWDNAAAGFHFIPEILHHSAKDPSKTRIAIIMGLYRYGGVLYLIEQGRSGVNIKEFYDRNTEVRPTVVRLTEDAARKYLGDPNAVRGYTTQGTLEEWTAIADCYFLSLNE